VHTQNYNEVGPPKLKNLHSTDQLVPSLVVMKRQTAGLLKSVFCDFDFFILTVNRLLLKYASFIKHNCLANMFYTHNIRV